MSVVVAKEEVKLRSRPAQVLVVFMLLLISVPMLGLLRGKPSVLPYENRAAAVFPPTPRSWAAMQVWPKQFEAYFTDHARGRGIALRRYHNLMYALIKQPPTEKVLVGRDGFLFYKGEDGNAFDLYFLGRPAFDRGQLGVIQGEFQRRLQWFELQGIRYVYVVVPEKYTVYDSAVPRRLRSSERTRRLEQVEQLLGDTGWNFLSLRPVLMEGRNARQLYYKTDSHWNGYGAWLGYTAIIDRLSWRLPGFVPRRAPVPPENGVDYYMQDLATMIGRPELGLPERQEMQQWYQAFAPQPRCASKVADLVLATGGVANVAAQRWRCNDPEKPLKAVVFRDSASDPLLSQLAEHFGETLFVKSNRYGKPLILEEKPDVVLEIIVERGIGGLADGYFHLQEQ